MLCCWAASAVAEAPRDKLSSTLSDLKSSKAEEQELRARLAGSAREVKALRADATDLAAELQAAERKVTAEERRASTLSARLDAKEKDFEARRQEYAATIGVLLRVEKLPATALIAQPDNAEEVLRTARVMQHVNGALAARATQLRTELTELRRLRDSAAASKQRLAKESATLNEKRKQLDRDLTKRQQLQERLTRDLAATEKRVAALSRESSNLQELIGKLESDRAAVARKTGVTPTIASTARGNWKQPVAGSVSHRFGERKNVNEQHRGLTFKARSGATVVAPSAGEVVFTGPFRDYGRMVLIKHGGGRISLLAGLGSIAVTLNQTVGAGEPLGAMGGGAPSLYYELREGAKPIDPAGWFAKLGA